MILFYCYLVERLRLSVRRELCLVERGRPNGEICLVERLRLSVRRQSYLVERGRPRRLGETFLVLRE